MPDGLYERDALAWSERQADLLRRLAAGERLNEAVDWPNVIEEVQDVGLSELRACESLIQQAITHLLKLHAWPGSKAVEHWRDEVGTFLDDAGRRFTPFYAAAHGLERIVCQSAPPGQVSTGRHWQPTSRSQRMSLHAGRPFGSRL